MRFNCNAFPLDNDPILSVMTAFLPFGFSMFFYTKIIKYTYDDFSIKKIENHIYIYMVE